MLDHAGPVGEVIVATPTQQKILADFAGVEAHAGIRPEDGSNAIAAAAAAIGRMELGRLDEDTTANVGVIEGGTSGNVVPGHCGIVAETRSLDAERAAKIAGDMTEACAWGASEHGCDVDVQVEELFRGYELPKDSPALALAEAGLRSAGLEPERVAIGGGSDANALRLDGFDCVLLANGTNDVHTADERVSARDLGTMLEVCEGIVAGCGCGVSGRLNCGAGRRRRGPADGRDRRRAAAGLGRHGPARRDARGRRGRRQRRRPRPRARLRRLRRRPRQPDPRARGGAADGARGGGDEPT